MQTIGVVINEKKAHSGPHMRLLGDYCRKAGMTLYGSETVVALAGFGNSVPEGVLPDAVEGVLAMGGDGTLLRAARLLNGRDCLLMGVNLGSLGYLTSLPADQLEQALECLRQDAYHISRRAKLAGRLIRGEAVTDVSDALNDVVVSRGVSARVIGLEVAVNNEPVTTYVCDGLIVSTPTGSTAYAMAAGGPIIMPETAALGLSVICPHTLSSRPLVLPDTVFLSITVRWGVAPLVLSIDGQDDHALAPGDRIEIRRSPRSVSLALVPDHSAYAVLSRKLGWGAEMHRKFAGRQGAGV